MEKAKLLLMMLSPSLIGLLLNKFVLFIPVLIYIGPFLMLPYWFWVGTKFAGNVNNPIKAILGANFMGIIALVVYYWQFIIVTDKDRNLMLVSFSQMFTAPLSYITARIGPIFEQAPNQITQVTVLVMQVAGVLLMMIVFSAGYFYKKKDMK